MHLGRCPSYVEGTVAFARLKTCPLCRDVIQEEDLVFVARPFALDPDLYQYVKTPMHWDCYTRWELRPRFARQYFEANVAEMRHNEFWGVAQCDGRVLLTVNPGEFVEEIDVLLAETGSSFRIQLSDWQDWIGGAWFEACRHEVEREILAVLVPAWRTELPTADAVVAAAGFDDQRQAPRRSPIIERICYEFAVDKLAQRIVEKGLACPKCGNFSNDYGYQRVELVSVEGPQSCFTCTNCGHEFGPADPGLP
jgi:hypothetical protein